MSLKLNKNINLSTVKFAVLKQMTCSQRTNKYPFEIQLIYKIIHEHSNYEEHQWSLFFQTRKNVLKNFTSLLLEISYLDSSLTWDCISVLSRYMNLYEQRHEITQKYLRK